MPPPAPGTSPGLSPGTVLGPTEAATEDDRAQAVSQAERIDVILDLVRALSQAATPAEVLRAYSSGMVRLNGPAGFISLSCRDTGPGAYRITRLLNDDNVVDIHKADPWNDQDKTEHRGGLLGEIVAHDRPVVINDLDVADDPVLGDAIAHYRSLLAVPLFERGEALNWGIQLRRHPEAYDTDALEDGLLRSNLVGNTVRHVRTAAELRKANQTIRDEVERIAAIQRALLPDRLPDIPGLEVAADYQTFDRAGGDMYFFHALGTHPEPDAEGLERTPDGTWGMLIADVSGHGPAAAVVMAMVESMLGGLPNTPTRPGEVLEYLNRRLCAKKIDTTFVTMFTLLYDPATRQLRYARAGHPPPLWRQPGRPDEAGQTTVALLDAVGGLPLGIIPSEDYPDETITLQRGDSVILYTDGIPETRDPDGKFFGVRGIEEAAQHCDEDADCTVRTIRNSVRFHERGGRPQDDQTLLVLRVK